MWSDSNLIKILGDGQVAIMPTDTIYGLVGRADRQDTVERIYKLRQRNPEKPCIILIGDIAELKKFSISLSGSQKSELSKLWPGPVSVILECKDEKFSYLHRGTHSLATRMPGSTELRELLLQTGPLLAPSANPEGLSPAKNIEEARKYFGDDVDLYINGGEISSKPSRLLRLRSDGSAIILRE